MARQQKLEHVAAVFGRDATLTQEWEQFVDLEAAVGLVPDVGKRVDAARGHPRDEFAVVREMESEAVGLFVVPGQYVGHECATRKSRGGCRFAAHDGMIPSFKMMAPVTSA